MSKKKRGKLSNQDVAVITKFAGKKPDSEIAEIINRTEETVKKFRLEKLGVGPDVDNSDYIQFRARLKDRPEYTELKRVCASDELEYATRQWTKYISQFKEDVLATEETQILQLIKFEIFMYRIELERKRTIDYIAKLEDRILNELQNEVPCADDILKYEEQKDTLSSSVQQHSVQYVKFQEKHDRILSSLKATRDQRIKNIQNASTTILGVIKELEREEFMDQQGREIELMKFATEKETARLAEYHEYDDGTVDQPLLNSRTIDMVEND